MNTLGIHSNKHVNTSESLLNFYVSDGKMWFYRAKFVVFLLIIEIGENLVNSIKLFYREHNRKPFV